MSTNLAYKLDEFDLETASEVAPAAPTLTVLSYGIGQDSWALLLKYVFDPEFRKAYAPGRFLVLSSSTGDEHPHTESHRERTEEFCRKHGLEYHHITPDQGFHKPSWQGLREAYRRTSMVGSVTFSKCCTQNLKLDPFYAFLEHWVGKEYGLVIGRKTGLKEFAKRYGKIHVLIGIAKGEERRIQAPEKETLNWKLQTITSVYPLVDLGMDRVAVQAYSWSVGEKPPYPSNCQLCHFMSLQELLWLHRFLPASFEDWEKIEAAKLAKNRRMEAVEVTDK